MRKNSNRKALTKSDIISATLDYIIIAVGSVVFALSVVIFTAPNNIAPGGFTAIATMLNYLFSLPIGTLIFVMNIPIFIWSAIENGFSFLSKTIIGTFFSSVAIDVLTPFVPIYIGDTLLASIFGGILNGLGVGLIFYRGGSTGGTDIVALNLHKRSPHISTGTIIFAIDAITLVMAFFVYGSLESILYAAISIYISIKVIDAISYGTSLENGKLMFIITDKYKEISDKILNNWERGVTLLDGEGAYSGEKKRVILCALRPRQVHKIVTEIRSIDLRAFIIVTTANSIKGEGFINK